MRTPRTPPTPTPRTGRSLPAAPVAPQDLRRGGAVPAALALLGLGLGVATVRHTASEVRRLRAAGANVPALRHEARLPGDGEPLRLVVVGDSAAAGHGLPDADAGLARQLARRLGARTGRPVHVASRAVDGATTADVQERQVPEIPADAGVVVVGVGVNDAVRRRSTHDVTTATRALLAAVQRAAPDATVVLLTCPDLASAPGLPRLLRPVVGHLCRRVAAVQRSVAAELGVAVARADGRLPAAAFGPDGFHPGPQGVSILADRVVRVLGSAAHVPSSGRPPASQRDGGRP